MVFKVKISNFVNFISRHNIFSRSQKDGGADIREGANISGNRVFYYLSRPIRAPTRVVNVTFDEGLLISNSNIGFRYILSIKLP